MTKGDVAARQWILAAAALAVVTAIVGSRAWGGQPDCLTSEYFGPTIAIERASGLPRVISSDRVASVALAHVGLEPQRILGTKLVQMKGETDALRLGRAVFLVSLTVPREQMLMGSGAPATSPCQVAVIDARTGEWLFSREILTAISDGEPIPSLEQ